MTPDLWRNGWDHGVLITGRDGRRFLVSSAGPVRELPPVAKGKASIVDHGTPPAWLVAARRSARRSEASQDRAQNGSGAPLSAPHSRGVRATYPLLDGLEAPSAGRGGVDPEGEGGSKVGPPSRGDRRGVVSPRRRENQHGGQKVKK